MNPKKFKLAKSIYRRYTAMCKERYETFGCNDRQYRLYSRIANMAGQILFKNGLTIWR